MNAHERTRATERAANGVPARPRYRRSNPGVARRTLKRSQRERLVDAMIELSAAKGYNAVTITELRSYAGVSPVTFYEHFRGKEDCFLAAYLACGEQIFGQMRLLAVEAADWWQATDKALDELLAGLERDPSAGRLLFIEALGAGAAVEEARSRVLKEFEVAAQALLKQTPSDAQVVDVPLMGVIGALRHIISRYLRTDAEDQLPSLREDGLTWLASYSVPAGGRLWSTSRAARLEDAPETPPMPAWEPETLPPGTHRLPAGAVARSHRTRLINATAEVMMDKGYHSTQVKDIVAAARVAKPVFYEHFGGKEQGGAKDSAEAKERAVLAAQEYPTQFILDSCAEAYFSADEWPERIWRMLAMLITLIVSNPAISHLRLVECYAAGPEAIRRAEEITRSFTIFLHEGYRHRAEAASLPRLCSHAIAGAIFEIIQRFAAAGEWTELSRHLPQLAYVAIAPFTGPREAIGIVEDLKARERKRAPRRRARRDRDAQSRVRAHR